MLFFRTGGFLQTWSEGYTILLHKKGSTSDVANFRGTSITLLSVTGNLYIKVLNNRRSDLAEQNIMFMLTRKLVLEQVIAQFIMVVFILHGFISHYLNCNKALWLTFYSFF